MNKREKAIWGKTLIAACISVAFLVPFFFMVTIAFKTNAEYFVSPIGIPKKPTLEHVKYAWETAKLGHAMINSFIVAVVAVSVTAICSLSSAFWFVIFRKKWANRLKNLMLLGYAFPAIIWIIPLFVIAARSGLTNNLIILGIIYGGSNIPFGIYLMHSFYSQVLTSEILEAARVDGAGILRQFVAIAAPLTLPALGALCSLVFVWSFGDLLFAATFLQDSSKWTLPLAASTLVSSQRVTAQLQSASACIAMIPNLLVITFAQKALVRGFGGGGSKG